MLPSHSKVPDKLTFQLIRSAGFGLWGIYLPTEAGVDPPKVAGHPQAQAGQVHAPVHIHSAGHWLTQRAQLICGGVGGAHEAVQQHKVLHGPSKAA